MIYATLIIIMLVCWIVFLYIKASSIERANLIATSNLKLSSELKDRKIMEIKRELSYWENKERYEEHLND